MMAQINQDQPQGEGGGPLLLVAEGGRETPDLELEPELSKGG